MCEDSVKTAALMRPQPAAPPWAGGLAASAPLRCRPRYRPRDQVEAGTQAPRPSNPRGLSDAKRACLPVSSALPIAGVGIAKAESEQSFWDLGRCFVEALSPESSGARLDYVQDGGHKLITSREAEKEVAAKPVPANGKLIIWRSVWDVIMFFISAVIMDHVM